MPSLKQWRSLDSRSRLRKARRRWLLRLSVAAVVLLGLGGVAYEHYAVWRDAARFPVPGQFVQTANGRRHVVCDGAGSPVVLFEVSGFSNATSFEAARAGLARITRVCSYDRAGTGWSDAAPATISAGMLADDLMRVQASVDSHPSIVVASSIGGLTAELFARRHPDRVAALVFLDAANAEMFDEVRTHAPTRTLRAGCSAVRVAGRVGLVRAMDPWHLRDADASARSAALMYDAKPWEMLCALLRGSEASAQEFAAAPPLPSSLPIVALSADQEDDLLPPALASLGIDVTALAAVLHETHRHLAERSQQGTWRTVPGSTHLIASSHPQAVIDAVTPLIALYSH